MNETTIPSPRVRAMRELLAAWRIEDDLATCRVCRRSLHISRSDEPLHHIAGCRNERGVPQHPWAALREILAGGEG